MLSDLLNIITPDALYHAIKTNPKVIELALQKFESCRSFGAALTTEQQIVISNNLDKVNDFFKSDQGKELLGILADDFVSFVNAK
jgi:hypothetical protein